MAKKIFSYIILSVCISILLNSYVFAREAKIHTHQFKGTVVSITGSRLQLERWVEKNARFISTFVITKDTYIIGSVTEGALVTVTYIQKRVRARLYKRIALVIKVINIGR